MSTDPFAQPSTAGGIPPAGSGPEAYAKPAAAPPPAPGASPAAGGMPGATQGIPGAQAQGSPKHYTPEQINAAVRAATQAGGQGQGQGQPQAQGVQPPGPQRGQQQVPTRVPVEAPAMSAEQTLVELMAYLMRLMQEENFLPDFELNLGISVAGLRVNGLLYGDNEDEEGHIGETFLQASPTPLDPRNALTAINWLLDEVRTQHPQLVGPQQHQQAPAQEQGFQPRY